MPEFWLDSGYRLLDPAADGELRVTDDFLRAYLMRPELEPVEESCDAECLLHESLMVNPVKEVSSEELATIADPDARENYQVLLEFRKLLIDAQTLEKCYVNLFKSSRIRTPPLFINQLVQIILRNIMNNTTNALQVRSAEMFFRDQKISIDDERLLAADAETIDFLAANSDFGTLGQLIVEAGSKLKSTNMDVLDVSNKDNYWERSNRFDTAINLSTPGEALKAFCGVLEQWVFHFYKAEVLIVPTSEINDDKWIWHVGLDAEASQILDELYNGSSLDEGTRRRLLALFKMEFKDANLMRPDIAGRTIYLGMAMDKDNILRLKPQNILMNLPLAASV